MATSARPWARRPRTKSRYGGGSARRPAAPRIAPRTAAARTLRRMVLGSPFGAGRGRLSALGRRGWRFGSAPAAPAWGDPGSVLWIVRRRRRLRQGDLPPRGGGPQSRERPPYKGGY